MASNDGWHNTAFGTESNPISKPVYRPCAFWYETDGTVIGAPINPSSDVRVRFVHVRQHCSQGVFGLNLRWKRGRFPGGASCNDSNNRVTDEYAITIRLPLDHYTINFVPIADESFTKIRDTVQSSSIPRFWSSSGALFKLLFC